MAPSIKALFRDRHPVWANGELIREELFSPERLEQHAESLAAAQVGAVRKRFGPSLRRRLRDNEALLLAGYREIATTVEAGEAITPAAEWVLDNYHIVEEQIFEIKGDLPPGYYRQLPRLAAGPFPGYPRVFSLAWAYVAHTDSRFDPELLARFANAYQKIEPLTIGELWAIAITLRIVLVENLRRATERIVSRHALRRQADAIADRVLGTDDKEPEPIAKLLEGFASPLPRTLVVQLAHRLRDLDPRVTSAVQALEGRLEAEGMTIEEVVRIEHQRQAAMNVTVRNIITSMRQVSAIDWTELVERVSLVDRLLTGEGVYPRMDFATRDLYRKAVEGLSRGSRWSELEVAAKAIEAARATPPDADPRRRDCGYHLIAGGRPAFEKSLGFRAAADGLAGRIGMAAGIHGYIGLILGVAALFLAGILALLAALAGGRMVAGLVVFALLGVIPAVDLAAALVNRLVSMLLGAKRIPSLDFSKGIAPESRTIVVVPTLLTSAAGIAELVERLEVHYLATGESDVTFALLSDWADSDRESTENDQPLLQAAKEGIDRLNQRYGRGRDGDRFLVLHRRRVWNESQGQWLGWERKRGKLHELNRLLRGEGETTFLAVDGKPPWVPPDVRYVVTLDSDTRLPRETVRRLVGKMAHPLNRPRFEPERGRVVEGYGILQPRVSLALPLGSEGSWFQRVFSASAGIDPYAATISDVYQDLCGEGSFVGKGIYDVDAFEAALAGRVPDNTILSHDLFEGIFARAGLVTDVEVVEEFPRRYDVATSRQHRWARGDWQLIPWLLARRRPDATRDEATVVGRWKILDNLRRTLSAPVAVLALLAGWTLLGPAEAAAWTVFILGTIALPPLIPAIGGLIPSSPRGSLRGHVDIVLENFGLALAQAGFLIATLVHQASLMVDAVGRTVWRLAVSRRRLLEWVTADQANSAAEMTLPGFYRWMAPSVGVAVVGALVAVPAGAWTLAIAAPVLIAWAASPVIAYRASLVRHDRGLSQLSEEGARQLRRIARQTWRFFETFVTPAENMLPPDNFQEDPKPVVAHRTSPTNVGLYLLSAVSARDFGWTGLIDMVERLEATLATMNRLQRFRGHFYNWYDTGDLRPLDPHYVSSVDSGNLAGHLISLASACREAIEEPLVDASVLAGIGDSLALAGEVWAARPKDTVDGENRQKIDKALRGLETRLAGSGSASSSPKDVAARLVELEPLAGELRELAEIVAEPAEAGVEDEMVVWSGATLAAIESHLRDLSTLMPSVFAEGAAAQPEAAFPSLAALAAMTNVHPFPRAATAPRQGTLGAAAETGPSAAGRPLAETSRALVDRLRAIADTARGMAQAMDFRFLLDGERNLLSIGYLAQEGRLDPNCYDLLASEARLASFYAIAKGDVPTRHWFQLGRSTTPIEGGVVLISWSGSMFEYLMPSLIMRAPAGSLLERSNRLVVQRQISYAKKLGLPWGISESAYNARDLELTYQYSNFGVPGLGLKRGLGANAVIAPYATGLAAMVDPAAAAKNYARLAEAGARGRYGYFEALDYTLVRVPSTAKVAVVRAYMAHHQGMSVVAIANTLLGGAMRRRFHEEPLIGAAELLLQERHPREVPIAHVRAEEVKTAAEVRDTAPPILRRFSTPHTPIPATQLLSNGRYAVMLTAAGSGYSHWHDLAVTRWREDPTADDWGSYIYLRDPEANRVWSATYQPTAVEPQTYSAAFTEDRAQYVRRDRTIMTTLEVIVSAEDDGEVRRVSLTNMGGIARNIEITSYAELVLAPPAADAAHPAFSKLFVETEYLADPGVILATRRKRNPGDPDVFAAHFAVVEGEAIGKAEFETDRAEFIGRGRDLRAPAALDGRPLSNTAGTVLDPIFALRRRLRVRPGTTARISFWTLLAKSREEVLNLVEKHRDAMAAERAATLAWTQAQVQLRHVDLSADAAALFQRLAGLLLYSDRSLRPPSDVIGRGVGGQPALWPHGISGDLPIVLVRLEDTEDIDIARQLVLAHEYWRMKHLSVDLVILNERASSYVQDFQQSLETIVRTSQSRAQLGGDPSKGRIFLLRGDLVQPDSRAALTTAARVVLVGRRGSLSEQVERLTLDRRTAERPTAAKRPTAPAIGPTAPGLAFFNGLGGFSPDGREYVTVLAGGRLTPAPWVNVVANPDFGFLVSTEGGGHTYAVNGRENQITPWSNDPTVNRSGEVLYVKDEDSGELWGPTAMPVRDFSAPYLVRHGFGYSRFQHNANGIGLELLQFVPTDDPLKISRLTIRNQSSRRRRLSVTAYVEWVLGGSRSASAPFVITEIDKATGALTARNPWNRDFAGRVAFIDLRGRQTGWTGDRSEFIGRHGSLAAPAGLSGRTVLSKRVGAGLDPCGVLQAPVDLAPGATVEIVALLGEAASAEAATALVQRYRTADLDAALRAVGGQWDAILGQVQVKTPDPAMDLMLNGWLLYQTVACRLFARSGFYQASGAYGFRDQLQDVMAVAAARPELTRAHLLRAAGRQFVDGDVQHWWLPATGQGVRTRISDDPAWLPFAVSHYLRATGDRAVLDESVAFLDGPRLTDGEHDSFFRPETSEERATLFEHCVRALERTSDVGAHGLPLMGTGDWNDGMNRVGEKGQGESVWLAWFLRTVLAEFAEIAEARGESDLAARWRLRAAALGQSLERDGWDGGWYRRGFFDDGTPFGSAASEECRIDSIAQSWAVIAKGQPDRAAEAMAAVDRELIRRDDRLALLFTPPFDKGALDPGYVKAYPPGLRENGGQYTHAAVWTTIAWAEMGEGDKAAELFAILNPISRAMTALDVDRYKIEPYVVAGDVYSAPGHVGRGGWSWYTGSAGWLYRAGLEWILGIRQEGTRLRIDPSLPKSWKGFSATVKRGAARYEITVENPSGVSHGVVRVELDTVAQADRWVPLASDGTHRVRVVMGK